MVVGAPAFASGAGTGMSSAQACGSALGLGAGVAPAFASALGAHGLGSPAAGDASAGFASAGLGVPTAGSAASAAPAARCCCRPWCGCQRRGSAAAVAAAPPVLSAGDAASAAAPGGGPVFDAGPGSLGGAAVGAQPMANVGAFGAAPSVSGATRAIQAGQGTISPKWTRTQGCPYTVTGPNGTPTTPDTEGKYMDITAMSAYQSYSVEELRVQDYEAGRTFVTIEERQKAAEEEAARFKAEEEERQNKEAQIGSIAERLLSACAIGAPAAPSGGVGTEDNVFGNMRVASTAAAAASGAADLADECAVSAIARGMGAHVANLRVQEHACQALLGLLPCADTKEWQGITCGQTRQALVAKFTSLAARGVIAALLQVLSTHRDSATVVCEAGNILRILARSDDNVRAIGAAGGINRFIEAMGVHAADSRVQVQTCKALFNLTCSNAGKDNRHALVTGGAIELVLKAMVTHSGVLDVQCEACLLLSRLAQDTPGLKRIRAAGGEARVRAALEAPFATPDLSREAQKLLDSLCVVTRHEICAGDRVSVRGITVMTQLNGKLGVVNQVKAGGMFGVTMEEGGAQEIFHSSNLKKEAAADGAAGGDPPIGSSSVDGAGAAAHHGVAAEPANGCAEFVHNFTLETAFQPLEDGRHWKSRVVNGVFTVVKVRGDEESSSELFARLQADRLQAQRLLAMGGVEVVMEEAVA